jgi:DNA topoisomerase VI subunit B
MVFWRLTLEDIHLTIQAESSNGVHRTTSEVLKKLESLNPMAEIIPPEPPTVQFVSFTGDQVATALNGFPKGSSACPFGISAGALSSMVSDTQLGSSVLSSLAIFFSSFVSTFSICYLSILWKCSAYPIDQTA